MDKFEKNELFDSLSKSEVYSKNEFYNSDEGSVVSMKHQLGDVSDPKEVTDLVTDFFEKVDQQESSKEDGGNRFSQAMEIFKKDKKEGIVRFIGGFVRSLFDGEKRSDGGKNNPVNYIDLSKFSAEQSLNLYNKLIEKSAGYANNPNNCMNCVRSASKALDDYLCKGEEKSTAIEHLVKEERLTPGDALIVNAPDKDMKESLIGTAIQGKTDSVYTHLLVVTKVYENGDFDCVDSHGGRGGVSRIKRSDYASSGDVDYMILDTPKEYGDAVVSYCESKIGAGYDALSAGIDALKGEREKEDGEFYCSELYINALEHAGMNVSSDIITPSDIMKISKPIYASVG